jgi:hypothetical protein
MNKKILTISLIILALILGGFYFWSNKYDQKIVSQEQEEIINKEVDTSDWETYIHPVYNFSFIHPKDIKVAVEFGKDQNKVNEFYLGESYLAILSKEGSVTLNDFINTKIMTDDYDVLYSFDNKLIIEPKIDQSVSFLVENGTYLHTTLYAHSQMAFMDLGGYYLWFTSKIGSSGDGDLSIQDVEIIKSIHSIIDTSDWNIYHDEDLGIEFKYPKDWEYNLNGSKFIELKDTKSEYYYEGDPTYLISVAISELPNDFSFKNWIKELTQIKEKRGGYVKNIQIGDQIDATESFDYLSHDTTIYFNNNKYIITKIHIDSINTEEIYQAILDSLRFIE